MNAVSEVEVDHTSKAEPTCASKAVRASAVGQSSGHEEPALAALQSLRAWLTSHRVAVPGAMSAYAYLHGSSGLQLAAATPSTATEGKDLLRLGELAYAGPIREEVELPGQGRFLIAGHPLRRQRRLIGSVLLRLPHDVRTGPAMTAAMDASLAAYDGPAKSPAAASTPTAAASPTRDEDWVSLVASCPRAGDAAVALVLHLSRLLDGERVTLALLDDRSQVRIVGSTDDWESERSTLAGETCAAMSEAIDAGDTICWPPGARDHGGVVLAHRQLSGRRQGRSLCTVPWFVAGTPVGALLAERSSERPFDDDELRLLESASHQLAPWFMLRRRLDRPWIRHTQAALSETWQSLHRVGNWITASAIAAVLAIFLGWPIEREIVVPARLEGAVQRTLFAPADTFLRRVHVRPGDTVRTGQPLAEFDVEDLQVERQRLTAEAAGHDAAVGDAMAKQDLAALALHHASLNEARARLALLDQRLARAQVVAPFDGVVIQGDLANAVGTPLKKGDTLMVLAPADAYRAVIEIDNDRIASFSSGGKGVMVLAAFPSVPIPMRIERVTPLAVSQPGRSYFEADVALQPTQGAGPGALRPGMQGIARFADDKGPRGAVWLHELVARARFAWWRWGV